MENQIELTIKTTKNGWIVEESVVDAFGEFLETKDMYCFISASDMGEFIRDYHAK